LLWLASLGPASSLTFTLLSVRWPLGQELATLSLYAAVLLLVAVLDLRHRLVYPLITFPATLAAMALTPLALDRPAWSGLAGALAGAAVFLGFYLLASFLYRGAGALGLGDVLVAGLVGAMMGFPEVWPALVLGTLFGGFGAILVGAVRRSRRAHFAYGPALCLGGLVLLLAGPKL
jgi:prepilin signal peptidase PulO-like enzyme (type II secretory pathway)